MSCEKLSVADCEMSDISSISEYDTARADTPTIDGNENYDSEDTLSDLSFDNEVHPQPGVLVTGEEDQKNENYPPIPAPRKRNAASTANGIKVKITDCGSESGMEENELKLDLTPGENYYKPSSVDFPRSPSQLKYSQGPSFLPKEDISAISEDESSVSSYRAHLDLNLQNGGGGARLTKKDIGGQAENNKKSFILNNNNNNMPNKKKMPELEGEEPDSLCVAQSVNGSGSKTNGHGTHNNQNQLHNGNGNGPIVRIEFNDDELSEGTMDDYLEDLPCANPLDNNLYSMQRATSFRRKIQYQLEHLVTKDALDELNNFDDMLNGYDVDEDYSRTPTPTTGHSHCESCLESGTPSSSSSSSVCLNCSNSAVIKNNNNKNINNSEIRDKDSFIYNGKIAFDTSIPLNGHHNHRTNGWVGDAVLEEQSYLYEEPEMSFVDIDAIIDENAPNLMRKKKFSFSGGSGGSGCEGAPMSLQITEDYFLQKDLLDKLQSVYESNNFHNLYNLSGELKDLLSPLEIEEIIANKEHLEKFQIIDHNVIMALSLSPESAVVNNSSLINGHGQNGSVSVSQKINGLGHHDNNNSESDFTRGVPATNSFRRKIHLEKERLQIDDLEHKYVETEEDLRPNKTYVNGHGNGGGGGSPKSMKIFDSLEVEDEINPENHTKTRPEDEDEPKAFLVRRDSKRFSKGKSDQFSNRNIQGLFVESKTQMNGTKRIKAPLNLDFDDSGDSPNNSLVVQDNNKENEDEDEGRKMHKKRISVDEKILSYASDLDSSLAADGDETQSDVFHSILNSFKDDNDITINDDVDDDEITLDIDTPDEMEESIMEQLESISHSPLPPVEQIPQLSADQEFEDDRRWKFFKFGAVDCQIDLKAIHPYRLFLSHGGYFDVEKKVAIILFSGCYLPDRSRKEYAYLMEHLFLYVLSTLEELIVEDYILVYLHGATPKSCMPTFSFLKKCYQLIDRRLRKNLRELFLVHPTFWLKTVVALTKPFISSKFSRKIKFINSLPELCLEIPTEHLVIPDRVLTYDAIRYEMEKNNSNRYK